MKKHTKIFFNYHGFGEQDIILCRVCGRVAKDIHHIEPKGIGGSKTKDRIENLIPLCRECHEKAHDNLIDKEYLKSLVIL